MFVQDNLSKKNSTPLSVPYSFSLIAKGPMLSRVAVKIKSLTLTVTNCAT
jgi:hypothetical protein